MTSIELQLCDIQGRLFKLSARRGISSAEFIKVFMKSATAKALDATYNRMQWAGEECLLEEVIDEAELCESLHDDTGGGHRSIKREKIICLRQEVDMLVVLSTRR